MTFLQAIIISIIEGITEFLPISSTAHMKFANPFLQIEETPFVNMFEVVIQLAAIFSVVVIYRKKFLQLRDFNFFIKLVIAVIPALIFGALFKKYIDAALSNLVFIASVMICGGIFLLFIDRYFKDQTITDEKNISNKNALIIGCFQVLSIIFPGLSRSAATIIGGMSQKLTRSIAAEFSFFLAVPTMFAASAKSFYDVYKHNPEVLVKDNFTLLGIGAVVSFIVALFSVKFFIRYLQRNDFRLFGYYRIALGVLFLLVSLSLGIKLT
jgi:undecaprenyl-diphosphatase